MVKYSLYLLNILCKIMNIQGSNKEKNIAGLKHCFSFLLTCLFAGCFGQNNLIVLTESGAKFTLYVNDTQINDSAQSQVTAAKIYDDTCRIKMVFLDNNISTFGSKVFLTIGGKAVTQRDFTYSLVTVKGKRKLKFISVNFSKSDTSAKGQSPEIKIKTIFTDLQKRKDEQDKLNEKYPPPANCIKPVDDSLLTVKIKVFRDNHTEMNRMKDVKWFVSHNCINTKQLIRLMDAFDMQDNKVRIAKFSFDYMEDHRNFLETLDAVKFMTEKTELKNFYDKKIEK